MCIPIFNFSQVPTMHTENCKLLSKLLLIKYSFSNNINKNKLFTPALKIM